MFKSDVLDQTISMALKDNMGNTIHHYRTKDTELSRHLQFLTHSISMWNYYIPKCMFDADANPTNFPVDSCMENDLKRFFDSISKQINATTNLETNLNQLKYAYQADLKEKDKEIATLNETVGVMAQDIENLHQGFRKLLQHLNLDLVSGTVDQGIKIIKTK